jgi:Flp pilus assembly protein TadD
MASSDPHHWFESASRLHQAGRLEEAEKLYRKVLDADPYHSAAFNNLANLLYVRGEFSEAINRYRDAVSNRPDFAEAWANLAGALKRHGDFDDAIEAARKALSLKPNFAEVHFSLADAYYQSGRYSEAINAFRQALAWRNNYPDARVGIGLCFYALQRVDEAIAEYRKAIALRPDHAIAHFNLGLALLLKGDFEHGLPEWEWRWKAPELGLPKHRFSSPKWDGTDLSGRRILVHAEQGAGDTLQFARYVPLLAAQGAKVVLYCQSDLRRLMSGLVGVEKVPQAGDDLGHFDFHCPLLSLPEVMGTRLETIPSKIPYISVQSAQTLPWQDRMLPDGLLKVGLVWAGRAQNSKNTTRSMTLAALAPLAQAHNATFMSLQKGAAAEQLHRPPAGLKIIDWTNDLSDFADTAALISALDLVIAVDTAVAHLAGAMGKPVWVILSHGADWRWFLNRSDSPWYPTARLFRQSRPNDWTGPVHEIAGALHNFGVR